MRTAFLVTAALALSIGACGDGDRSVATARADQVRAAALEAGLDDDVADVLALAARGTDATFQLTYPGTGGAVLRVSQAPPNRRIDVIAADHIVESQVVRGAVAYRCQRPAEDVSGPLACTRTAGALPEMGAFDAAAIDTFTQELSASRDRVELAVEARQIAGVDATCLVATPRADPRKAETICLSAEGAQLLVEREGERVEADSYDTTVPDSTFDV